VNPRDLPDFHTVRPEHYAIHDRLLNWARWVDPGRGWGRGRVLPMFKDHRNGYEQSSPKEMDPLDGQDLEKDMRHLPEKVRKAIKWAYLDWWKPVKRIRGELGVTSERLIELIHEGRTMLKNRSKQ